MRIDDRVEPLVREVLAAAVKADEDRFARALQAFPDDAAVTNGVQLAMSAALYVLQDQYGRRPTDDELHTVAARMAETENWTEVCADDVVAAITAALNGRRGDEVLPMVKIVTLPFIIAAYLLAAGCAEGEHWFNYLDRAEAAIESS